VYPAAVAIAHFTRVETWATTLTGAWLLIRLLSDAFVRAERRNRAGTLHALAESRCPRCSSVYGMAAAEQAEREYQEWLHAWLHTSNWYPDTDGTDVVYRRPRLSRFPCWTVCCPHCGGGWEFDTRNRKMRDRRHLRIDDPEADEIARRNGVHIPEPKFVPDPVPGAEWGEALCSGCGARKRHWADSVRWQCARCGTPLGDAPPAPEEEDGEDDWIGPWS